MVLIKNEFKTKKLFIKQMSLNECNTKYYQDKNGYYYKDENNNKKYLLEDNFGYSHPDNPEKYVLKKLKKKITLKSKKKMI